jgi:uncharacterized protein
MKLQALLQWLRARLGSADAQYRLALSHWFAAPERRSARRALYWARRAMQNGAPDALGLIYVILHESGQENEAHAGIVLAWQMAAEQGNAGAQFSLGQCYELGDMGLPRDIEKALKCYTKAAIGGSADAKAAVARLCSARDGSGRGSPG